MSRRGLGQVVRAGVGRRRVTSAVIALTLLLTVGASVLATGLVATSSAPFQQAFTRLQGAHLTAEFDGSTVTVDQLSATAQLPGVTAAAGPIATLSLRPRTTATAGPLPAGVDLPAMTVAGRADHAGDVDRLELLRGRWHAGAGEIVCTTECGPFEVGDRITFPQAPGSPTLTVVGVARSVSRTAQAWVSPDQLDALRAPGAAAQYQMLYRFENAGTETDVSAARAAIAAAVPDGSLIGASSYLTIKEAAERAAATFAPFVVAFGALGLVMSVLVIGIVVSGAVSAGTRRIGILKALGFTPAQVTRAYVAQALIPAAAGAAAGVVLGNLAAIAVLAETGDELGTGVRAISPWISLTVPLGALLVVTTTALVPALRAARLRTVDAIAMGRTPAIGRGRLIRRLLGRLPVPRPVSLGLGNPFSRPGRSAVIATAVALGSLGVTFGAGLGSTLVEIQDGLNRREAGDVIVQGRLPRPGGPFDPTDDGAAIQAAIEAQPGTLRYFRTGRAELQVAGVPGSTTVVTFTGDASWGAYELLSGRWFVEPGEAVVPTGFLNTTGTTVGDTITLTTAEGSTRVRIVGEVLDLSEDGMRVITDSRSLPTLAGAAPTRGDRYHIELEPSTDLKSYVDSLNAVLTPLGAQAQVNVAGVSETVVAMHTLAAVLTVLLVTVAALGVLSTVVLDTRERVHDLGVYKALGMSPRQVIAMVLVSVGLIGVAAGLLGVPAGIWLHHWVVPTMADAAGTGIGPSHLHVYDLWLTAPLLAGGLVIALVGALLPAGWAARTGTITALRTE